jgi:hypothetical protein
VKWGERIRSSVLILLTVMLTGGILIGAGVMVYSASIGRELLFLTSQTRIDAVFERFGSPAEVFLKGQKVQGRGWPAPSRTVEHKMLVFVRGNGMKYFVYVDEDGEIAYIYSSRS